MRVDPRLCVACRAGRNLCGLAYCPLLARSRALVRLRPLEGRRGLYGSSPPSAFVGRAGYPKVSLYPAAPPVVGDTSHMEDPSRWLEMPLEDFLAMRLSLVRGAVPVAVEEARRPGPLLQAVQLAALSQRPVDLEMVFARPPSPRPLLDEHLPPMGPSAPLERFRQASSESLPRAAERAYADGDMDAREAVLELYRAGLDVPYISRALSLGALGAARRRRLVPTRWAITAVDKALSDALVERVKAHREVDGYYLYVRKVQGNTFVAILAPGRWAFEWGEAWFPGSTWNPGGAVEVEVDWEGYFGRRTYPDIGGCYYAARLAAAEALDRMGRQAAVLMWREIYSGFDLPVGVWFVRENARRMFAQRPQRFDTLEEAVKAALAHLRLDSWPARSALVPRLRRRLA